MRWCPGAACGVLAKQDEYCLYTSGCCLPEVSPVDNVVVDVVVDIGPMWDGFWCTAGAVDARIKSVGYHLCEAWLLVPAQGPTPGSLIKGLVVFCDKRCVKK